MASNRLEGERIGVWGRSGSGKTSWAKQYLRRRRRVVIFDPQGDFGDLAKVTIEHDRPEALDTVRLAMAADPAGFVISYRPPSGREPAALNALAAGLWQAQSRFRAGDKRAGLITLVVEDISVMERFLFSFKS